MYDFNKCLKKQSTDWGNHTEVISLHKDYLMQINNESHQPKIERVIPVINSSASFINLTISTSSLILDRMFSAHEVCSAYSANTVIGR